jgi:hypothetical protein
LDKLTTDRLGREWQREDGAAMRIGLCLIDANAPASLDADAILRRLMLGEKPMHRTRPAPQ